VVELLRRAGSVWEGDLRDIQLSWQTPNEAVTSTGRLRQAKRVCLPALELASRGSSVQFLRRTWNMLKCPRARAPAVKRASLCYAWIWVSGVRQWILRFSRLSTRSTTAQSGRYGGSETGLDSERPISVIDRRYCCGG